MHFSKEVYIAALFSDFAQFNQQPLQFFFKKFEPLFSRYCDFALLLEIAQGKHEASAQLLTHARALSLSECRHPKKQSGLSCVFSHLTATDSPKGTPWYYPVQPFGADAFPQRCAKTDGYANQLSALEADCRMLQSHPPAGWEAFIMVLSTILKKHLWCIPAVPGDDISLFDHAKVTAAICSCHMAGEVDSAQPYKLLTGDFSGIQNYIFSVSHTGTKGVAKRLRARSFYVDATVTVLAHALTERFSVPQGNILMLTGGKFYILLPNKADSDSILNGLMSEMDAYFYRVFHGEISVNLAWIDIGAEGLRDYSSSITTLSRRLSEQKSRQFSSVLRSASGWTEDAFVITENLTDKKLCPSCGRCVIDSEDGQCKSCADHTRLGQELTRARYIVYSRDGGDYRLFGDYGMTIAQTPKAFPNAYLVEQLNQWSFSAEMICQPLGVRVMANNLPVDEQGEVMTFGDLAQKARGIHKLGVLKADVDNLGYLFSDGLREPDRHYGTISRVGTMSRMLELFFSGYVQALLKERFPTVYSVFSGGDDLFLIGPWDVLPELACQLQQRFRVFVAENPAVTLSAAICIADPKTHIASLAELCETRLKQVKNECPQMLYPGKDGRDGIYFMDVLFSWDDFSAQLEQANKIAACTGEVDIAILRRIARYSEMYQRFLETHDVFQLTFAPLFHYDRKRNYGKLRDKAVWFQDYAGKLYENAANYRVVKKDLYFAQTCVRYALNKTKEERENDTKS